MPTVSSFEKEASREYDGGDVENIANRLLEIEDWLAHETTFIAKRVSQVLSKTYGEAYGVNVVGWRILSSLAMTEPMSPAGLSELTSLSQVSISKGVTSLHKLGMISRRADGRDRRKINLRLTGKGWDCYRRVAPVARDIQRRMFEDFSDEEVSIFRSMLLRLRLRATELE